MSDSPERAQAWGCGVMLILALIGGAFVLKACSEDSALQQKPFDAAHAVRVEAVELQSAFDDNEIDANNRYGASRSLIVIGTISAISSGSPASVDLLSGDPSAAVSALVADEQKLAAFRPAQTIELHCVGARKSLARVVIDSCNSISTIPPADPVN
ncbi:OB-fold protein [Sphingomonas sp. 10B4]|uniref:OB-fold protein n=1 Tax=Sphingomonas sp. 10B4 TaxID=3048575 RepID=UPI002AB363C2|nr:hypothetical protein [Sphingomonas sp. 10B4]MDY7525517.1 hypothetical protein [Sphingomonas sp. 10B4]MEB0281463.1 hypothetical protein [Sphingomonas sp. 10B4]